MSALGQLWNLNNGRKKDVHLFLNSERGDKKPKEKQTVRSWLTHPEIPHLSQVQKNMAGASTPWHGYREKQTPLHGRRASSWRGTLENNVAPLKTTVTSTWDPRLCRQPSGMKATPLQDTRPMVPMLRIHKQPKESATEDAVCRKVPWGQFGEVPQGPEVSS